MPKSIKSREPQPDDATPAPRRTEAERFAAESVAVVYLGPDDAILVDGKSLKHHAIVRVWPQDAANKCAGELFRPATPEEAAANQAACCPGCANGGQCLAPTLSEEG